MNIRHYLTKKLNEDGFDGLWNGDAGDPACGCPLDDLIACGETCAGCQPAYKHADGLMYPHKEEEE